MTSTGAGGPNFPEMRGYTRFHDGFDYDDPYGTAAAAAAADPLLGSSPAPHRASGEAVAEVDEDDGLRVSWRRAWRALLKKGNDVESARVNHNFTPEERIRLSNVESIDYLAPNSATYRKWLARQPHRRNWDRWVMMGSIGVATGLVAHLLYVLIGLLASFKYGVTRWLLGHTNVGVAWLFNVTVSVALVAASSAAVIGWAPQAQGSGVPEVMAYLNGCMLPKLFNVATLVVKFVSCGLVVASGLPVGPEGPLLHIGAAIGAALSQGHSTTMGFNTAFFRRFRNPKDKRDFVTAGVSVGVAAAFNAPIGGLLFAFEEVASFWQQRLGWQVFYACMCATLTLNLSRSAGKALAGKGSFGWFDKEVTFEQTGMSFSSHVLAVVPAAVIGLAAGLMAIVFTVANIKVTRLRAMLTGRLRWKRAIEPCVLAAVYITGVMLLPITFFHCTPTECVIDTHGEMQCNSTGIPGQGIPNSAPALPLYTCRDPEQMQPPPPAPPSNAPPFAPPGTFGIHAGKVSSGGGNGGGSGGGRGPGWLPSGGSITPDDAGNGTVSKVYYNELATLLFSTGEEGIKHLLARGTHRLFGYRSLAFMGAYYFVFAVLVAGSAVASGLFVPMLMIGAVLGRICGLATVDIAQGLGKRWSVDTFGPWTWIDPGAFALVGAGAFMGGVTRMTVALAVIMIEVSSDVHMLLPVLVAIMVAKWVADAATHSLYHGLLQVKCVPFLPSEPVSALSLDLLPVSYVMKSPVICLRRRMTVRELSDVLRRCKHNGFPVLRDELSESGGAACGSAAPLHEAGNPFSPVRRNGPGTCCGLISRGHLLVILQKALLRGHTEGLEVDWTELNRKMMDPVAAAKSMAAQQMAVLRREMAVAGADSAGPSSSALQSDIAGLSVLRILRAAAAAGGGAMAPPQPLLSVGWGHGSRGDPGLAGGHAHEGRGRGQDGEPLPTTEFLEFNDLTFEYGGFGISTPAFEVDSEQEAAPRTPPPQRGPNLQVPAAAASTIVRRSPGNGEVPASAKVKASGGAESSPGGLVFGDGLPEVATSTAAVEGGSSLYTRGAHGLHGDRGHGDSLESGVIDLMPYINTSVFMVPDSFSVERTYVLFRTMGLRHLIVVDEQHTVKGIVTRKDLLGYRLDDALARALNGPNHLGSNAHTPSGLVRTASIPGGAYTATPATSSLGNGAVASGSAALVQARPAVVGGGPASLHPTTAGMRNLLVNGDVARPSAHR